MTGAEASKICRGRWHYSCTSTVPVKVIRSTTGWWAGEAGAVEGEGVEGAEDGDGDRCNGGKIGEKGAARAAASRRTPN